MKSKTKLAERYRELIQLRCLLCAWALSAFALAGLSPLAAHGQVFYPDKAHEELKSPLLDYDPFDLIYLGDYDKFAIMKVLPFEEPIPDPKPGRGVLVFDFAHEQESRFQVPWDRVVQVKTYNQLLIEEANNWLQEKEFSKAFRNLLYVYDNGGQSDPKIVKSLQTCLFQDGTENFRSGNYELALSIFEDMYLRDKNFNVPGINRSPIEIIMACYDGIARKHFENADFLKTRNMLTAVRTVYEKDSVDLLRDWQQKFAERSDELIEEARQLAAAGDGIAAHMAARNANTIFPNRPENKALYEEILQQFPIVFVGVTQGPGDANPIRVDHWGARRVGRLTQRTFVEFIGLTDEGGHYDFLNGEISQVDDLGFEYRLKIDPTKQSFGVPPISAYQVARRLQSAGEKDSPYYSIPLAKILETIKIEDETSVVVRLRIPFVRPEALMQLPYEDRDEDMQPIQDGPYVWREINREKKYSTFKKNPSYADVPGRQHPDIIEREFPTASDAVDALIKGDIDIVDRVPVADINRLKRARDIEVRPYVIPSVHMLVPNQRTDFGKDSNFRGGLLRGINRENLVREMICNGVDVEGCEVISGPFPIGTLENDQVGYGYNRRAPNMPYNFKLGMVLVEIVTETMVDKLRDEGVQNPTVNRPAVVLAYPNNDTARIACTAISRDWSVLGVQTQLRPLDSNTTIPEDDKWDYLYVDATLNEPLVDAAKLFGEQGFSKTISATIHQSTKMLSEAHSWQKACATLRRVHRQSTNEVAIMPLFQLKEHYAYRTNVHDVGRSLIHLYQNIERWRIDSEAEKENN